MDHQTPRKGAGERRTRENCLGCKRSDRREGVTDDAMVGCDLVSAYGPSTGPSKRRGEERPIRTDRLR